MLKGNDLVVYVDGVAVGAARSCEMSESVEPIEVSSPYSSEWREFRDGWKSWSVTANHLVTSFEGGALGVGSVVEVKFIADGRERFGRAICTEWRVTAQWATLAQGSMVFQGCGELS
jgi:hypothetical protein